MFNQDLWNEGVWNNGAEDVIIVVPPEIPNPGVSFLASDSAKLSFTVTDEPGGYDEA